MWSLRAAFLLLLGAESQLQVLAPSSLVQRMGKDVVIEGSTATFGTPSYGDSLIGTLFTAYSGSVYCTADYGPEIQEAMKKSQLSGLAKIFVAERGGCSFAAKARVAEALGADALLVVNREVRPAEDSAGGSLDANDVHSVIMADDGSGQRIRIPSVLLPQQAGDHLLAAALRWEIEPAVVEIAWSLPKAETVVVDFWMDAANAQRQELLGSFAPIAVKLGKQLELRIHFNIFGISDDRPNADAPSYGKELCHPNSLKFCAEPPPPTPGGRHITGQEVLMVELQQLCFYASAKQFPVIWLDYVQKFPTACPLDGSDDDSRFGQKCSLELIKKTARQWELEQIDKCMRLQWSRVLEDEKENKAWSASALRINGAKFEGLQDPWLLARAICVSLEKPEGNTCDEYRGVVPPRGPVVKRPSRASIFGSFLIFLAMIGLLACGIGAYQQHLRKTLRASLRHEVMLEVKNQMSQYQAIDEGTHGGLGSARRY